MKRVLIIFALFLAVLLSSGCLTYDVRQELPTKIEVTEKPITPIESPIECKTASCLTFIKEVDQKNLRWECSPLFKGANDDPAGTVYYQDKGDVCKTLPAADTLCLQYDCAFNKDTFTGYYKAYYQCLGEDDSIDNWGVGYGVAYPNEDVSFFKIYTKGIGSVGRLPSYGFACNAMSSESRGKGYNTLCDYQDGCYTCVDWALLITYEPRACPAEMPILYPYNAKGFTYNPVINTDANPGREVIRDLRKDYTKLGKLATAYANNVAKNSKESEVGYVKGCEEICSDLVNHPEKADECNKCSKEHSNDEIEEPQKSSDKPVDRGYTLAQLNGKCNGLNPCVEIDRAGIGVVDSYIVGGENTQNTESPEYSIYTRYAKCDRGDYPGEKGMRYFICSCRCKQTIRATYECRRAGNTTAYYYSYCKESKDKTSQGGYVYEFHNFSGGAYKIVLGNATSEIPIFLLGQGPTFKDYELAKKLCAPSNPADVTITGGKLPFVPSNLTVFEGAQFCLINNGAGAHSVYSPLTIQIYNPSTKSIMSFTQDVRIANLSSGASSCIKTGEGTNFTVGQYTLYLDDNKIAKATVKVVKPTTGATTGVVKAGAGGRPVFLYNGELELDGVYASGPAGQNTLNIIDTDGSVRKVSADTGEHTDKIGNVKFSYVAYTSGDKITISGEGEPVFAPRAIVLSAGSKLCVVNTVESGAKNLLLEKKVNYTPETYVPIAAKRSLYGLECCFDIPDPGVYRVSDSDYLNSMKAYVVVFPSKVAPLITINDYGYTPISSLAKRDDYVCITNPIGANRTISYTSDKGGKGTLKVRALEDYCTYDLTKTDANYNFTDMLTGAKFYLSTTSGSVLNIDVYKRTFIPKNGRVDKGGQVCLNAVDSNVTLIFAPVSKTSALTGQTLTGQTIQLAPGQKRCIEMSTEGLFTFRNKGTGLDCFVAVGDKGVGYIVNGTVIYTPLDVMFPDYAAASTNPLYIDLFTKYPKVTLHNLDDVSYVVYNELTIRNGTGFSTHRLDLVTPHTIIYNKAPYDVTIKIISRALSKTGRTITIPKGGYEIYTYDSDAGDYRIVSVTNLNVKPVEGGPAGLGTNVDINGEKLLDSSGVVVPASGLKEITVRSVGGTLVSLFSYTGSIENPSTLPQKKGVLVIRGSVEGGESVVASKFNFMKTLGFGVQTLSGVPTNEELMQARKMLAIDNSIPVFLYSRIGKVTVGLVDPATTETYRINTGALVKVSLDSDISKQEVVVSDKNIDPSKYNGASSQWIFNMPTNPVNFTIKKGSVEKKVELVPQTAVKEVRMSYTQYRVDTHGNENYMLRVHNLAVEPRAVMLRPNKINEYCQIGVGKMEEDLSNMWSPIKMQVYKVYNVSNNDLDALENHDSFVRQGVSKITDITLLPNMGYKDISLELGRSKTSDNTPGQLTLRAKAGSTAPNTQASKISTENRVELSPGYVSGLKDTQAVRVYRIFSSQVQEGDPKTTINQRYLDVGLSTDVYGGEKYAVIVHRFAPLTYLTENELISNINLWKGAVFAEKNYNLLPRVWKNVWEGENFYLWSGCGSSHLIVPFSNDIYPNEFAYSAPAILGFKGMNSFREGYDNYMLLKTAKYNYPVLPQAIGNIRYNTYTFKFVDHLVQDIDLNSGKSSSETIVPTAFRITNGEVLTEFGLVFYDENNGDIPCGKMYTGSKFSETGDLFGSYDGDPFTDKTRFKCGTGTTDYKDDYEAAIKAQLDDSRSYIVYNKYGGYCYFGDDLKFENGEYVEYVDNQGLGLKNTLWCHVTTKAYGNNGRAIGAQKDGSWNFAYVWKGLGDYKGGSENYDRVIELKLDSSYGNERRYSFIAKPYYEFPEPACDVSSIPTGNKFDGGVPENAFAGGIMFLLNDVSPAKSRFDENEIEKGTSEMSMGYALTNKFTIPNTQLTIGQKAACFGESTFDGIQEVIAPQAVNIYTPDAHGEYAIYDSPFYPNFKLKTKDGDMFYYHLSPFATDSGSGNVRSSLDKGKLGTVMYDVPKTYDGIRYYRDARFGINDFLGKGDLIKDGKEHVADVYLYNLTIGAVANGVVTSVDIVDVMEGDFLLLNNTGEEPIVWYYGIITPCVNNDDIEDKIKEKMAFKCDAGKEKDCITNPKKYSISPIDMDNYLNDVAASSPNLVSRVVIAPREKRIVETSMEGNAPNSIKLVLPANEQSATYVFYNPYSGKRMMVRVSKHVENILLQINSFSPSSVSLQPGGTDSELCILNKDKVERKILYETLDGNIEKEVIIKPGNTDCNVPSYFNTHKAKDALTGKYLTVGEDKIGGDTAISQLKDITAAIALSKEGADNPAYKFQVLNPKAAATPAIITTEIIDVDAINPADDSSGIVREVEIIEGVCRLEMIRQESTTCGQTTSSQAENLKIEITYDDVKLTGCCCRQVGTSTECRYGLSEIECNTLRKAGGGWGYGQCPVGCCCTNVNGNKQCEYNVDENTCKNSKREYSYFCPTKSTVYKQRCISTLPFFIHIKSGETSIGLERINKMKQMIDAVYDGLQKSSTLKDAGEKLDLIGYVVVIDDPGVGKRGQCSLSGYIDDLRNVSQYAATRYGIPSMIIGLGLNRNIDEKNSCWSNTELADQTRRLFSEDIMIMVGSGIIGMGQYCLVDTSCQPLTSGKAGADYGLYYDVHTSSSSPFAYGVNRADVIIGGVTSFSDYLRSLPSSAFGSITPTSTLESISMQPSITLPTRAEIRYNVMRKVNAKTGNITYVNVKPTYGSDFTLGTQPSLQGNILDSSTLGNVPTLGDQVGGLSGGANLQYTNLVIDYINYLSQSGVVISGLSEGSISLPALIDQFNNINLPSNVLSGTYRKDPYARVWFDQCGKYYYEGEGQTLIIFSETDIPRGQQGNQCDPSRMMELYKKYKCD
ncbi:MAG: hypothetical protein QXS93_00025 [Candidatus Micrarchaeia archaeon]